MDTSTGAKDNSVHGPGATGTVAAERWDAMSWYTTPIAEDRCEPPGFTSMKAATAAKACKDIEKLMKLPDDGECAHDPTSSPRVCLPSPPRKRQ